MLLPNRIGAVARPAAVAPTTNGAAAPKTGAAKGAASVPNAAAPRPRPNCVPCSPTTSPAYVSADPILLTSLDCSRLGCSRDLRMSTPSQNHQRL